MAEQKFTEKSYLATDQYKDSAKLAKRANLHTKYGSGDWFGWVAQQADVTSGAHILDIGCGAGWFWEAAQDQLPDGLDITLADQSEGMVSEASERVRSTGKWDRVAGIVADVCALPFADASFDRVFALHMLYHADDQPAAVTEIARVLKPGGIAVVSTNGRNTMRSADLIRLAAFDLPDEPVINFTLENGAPLLERAFDSVTMRKRESEMRVTDPVDLFDYLTSFPPGDHASEAELKKLENLVAEGFDAGNGVFVIPLETGVFLCRN